MFTRTFATVLLCLCLITSAYGADITNGLVAHWSFDDCTLKDVSGKGNDGVFIGNPQCVNSVSGKGLKLNGAGDVLNMGNSIGNFGTSDFAVNFWMSKTSAGLESIISKRDICGYSNFWEIRVDSTSSSIEFSNDYNNYTILSANKNISDGNYHNVSLVRANNTLKLYIDGVLDTTKDIIGVYDGNNTSPLLIGRSACIGQDNTVFFSGVIDDVRIYNRALPDTDIQSLFHVESVYASPAAANFGSKNLLDSASKQFTITNSTKSPVNIGTSSLSGPNATDFSLGDSCSGLTLAPKATCNIVANYQPRSCGSKSAAISVPYGTGTLSVPLAASACAAGNAAIGGIVRDADTKLPVSGARVVMGDLSAPVKETTTGMDGSYSITDIVANTYYLSVKKSGYDQNDATTTLFPQQSQLKDFQLQPATTGFRVVSVKSKYSNGKPYYFLPSDYIAGQDVNVQFIATVDWNGKTPGKVRFTTPRGSYIISTTTTTAAINFNITTEFDPCTTLSVEAIADDNSQSAAKNADFIVTKKFNPNMDPPILMFVDEGGGYSYASRYSYGEGNKQLSLMNLNISSIQSGVPFLAGESFGLQWLPSVTFGFGSAEQGKYRIAWEDQTKGNLFEKEYAQTRDFRKFKRNFNDYVNKYKGKSMPKIGFGSKEASLFPFIDVTAKFNPESCSTTDTGWDYGGDAGLAFDFSISKTWQKLYVIPTPIPIPVPWYAKAVFKATGDASLNVLGKAISEEDMKGSLSIKPALAGTLGAGVDGSIGIEGTITGEFGIGLVYPGEENKLDFSADASGRAYVSKFSYNFVIGKGYWCLAGSCKNTAKSSLLAIPGALELIPRDYLSAPAPQAFMRAPKYTLKQVASPTQNYNVASTPIISSTFPQSAAFLSSAGNSVNLLWLTDNTLRSNVNGTMLMHSTFDGSVWSTPVSVADNGTADFNPASLSFSDGSIVATWEDVKTALADTATLEDMTANQEISAAIYNPTTKTWGTALRLTDNSSLDRTPKLAGKAKDNLILTWVGNGNNDLSGSAANPNKLWYALFDGTSWSTPQVAATIPNSIKRFTVANDGSTAHVVLTLDSDGDQSTLEDLELYKLTFAGGTWGTLTRLTMDTVIDDNPQLALDPTNAFVLTWVKGGELSSVVNFDFTNRTVIRSEESYSSTLADYKQAIAGDGKVAVIYADTSENSSSDLFAAFFDPVFNLWGQPKQLTFDNETEMRPSIAFMGSETILAVYNRKLLINPDGTPTTGALTDLFMLTHTMGNDLALEGGSLTADPATAAPGESVILSVNAQNLGDRVAQNIPITFYNGDPAAGGAAIGSATISAPFKPGAAQAVTLPWTIPNGTAPVTVFAVIDPASATDTLNRANNVTNGALALPDLEVKGIQWEKLSNTSFSLTLTITNNGGTASGATTLKLRKDSASGAQIISLPVKALARFETIDLNYIWDVSAIPQSDFTVFAVVDEENAIAETDELNNGADITLPGTIATLTVQLNGSGSGTITSDPMGTNPSGISCLSGTCTTSFPYNQSVSLLETAGAASTFGGWGVACSGKAACNVVMDSPKTVTATFTLAPKAVIGTTGYTSLNLAYTAAAISGSTILALDSELPDNGLEMKSDKAITLKGGYKADYSGMSGNPTMLRGPLTIGTGSLTVEGLVVK